MEELEELVYKAQNKDMDSFEKLIQNIRSDLYRIERLNSLGVIGLAPKAIYIGNGNSRQDSYITLNRIGKIYSDIIFRKE